MKMKTDQSGYDGMNSYEPGIVNMWPGHAKKVFILNHGVPVDENEDELEFDDAVAILKLNSDELAEATANRAGE